MLPVFKAQSCGNVQSSPLFPASVPVKEEDDRFIAETEI
jgi:hypothetical protein